MKSATPPPLSANENIELYVNDVAGIAVDGNTWIVSLAENGDHGDGTRYRTLKARVIIPEKAALKIAAAFATALHARGLIPKVLEIPPEALN